MIVLKAIQSITRLLEWIAPSLAVLWARTLFFFPSRRSKHDLDLEGFGGSWTRYRRLNGQSSQVRTYVGGQGPTILLLHGWESSVIRLYPLARDLVQRGFRVVSFDYPAHGVSPERQTNALEIHRIILNLQGRYGPFLGVIGHSFGGVIAGYSLRHGVYAQRLITIGSPTCMNFVLDRFRSQIRATRRTVDELKTHLSSILAADFSTLSLADAASNLPMGGLVVHDRDDRIIPFSQALPFHQNWSGAALVRTENLGHNRILKDSEVVRQIAQDLENTRLSMAG